MRSLALATVALLCAPLASHAQAEHYIRGNGDDMCSEVVTAFQVVDRPYLDQLRTWSVGYLTGTYREAALNHLPTHNIPEIGELATDFDFVHRWCADHPTFIVAAAVDAWWNYYPIEK